MLLNCRCYSISAGLFAQSPQGLVALLSLKPRRLFISLHEQRNEAKKFAVCTFLPTPALFSAKQKELALLKQLFVFHAPKSISASRQKSEAGPYRFFRNIATLGGVWCFLFFALLVSHWCSPALLRLLGRDVFEILNYALLGSGWQRNEFTSEAMCPPRRAIPASVEKREEIFAFFR